MTRKFDVFFDLRPKKRLSKQLWGWWFETPSCQLWRHSNNIKTHWPFTEELREATLTEYVCVPCFTPFNTNCLVCQSTLICSMELALIPTHCGTRSPAKYVDRYQDFIRSLRWRHNDHSGVSNHQPHGCLLNRLFRCKSKKTSKLRVTGLCAGNSPGTGEFPAQMASYAENVSIWWRHHVNPPDLRSVGIILSWPCILITALLLCLTGWRALPVIWGRGESAFINFQLA